MAHSYQDLYELADREFAVGHADVGLLSEALRMANGNKTLAREHYCRLRADNWTAENRDLPAEASALWLREVRDRLDRRYQGKQLRANIAGWLWVVVCFAAFCAAYIFFTAAHAALGKNLPSFYRHAIAGVGCIILAITAFIVCKKDAGRDPFA